MGTEKDRKTGARPAIPMEGETLTYSKADEILRGEFRKPAHAINVQAVKLCCQIVGRDMPEITEEKAEQAWAVLKVQIAQRERRRVTARRHRRTVIFALVAVLLVASICVAAGIIPWIRDMFWDSDRLNVVVKPAEGQQRQAAQPRSDRLGQAFIDILDEHRINAMLPTWLPEGYTLESVQTAEPSETWIQVVARYATKQHTMFIQVDAMLGERVFTASEKGIEPLESYMLDDTAVALYENADYRTARYISEPYNVEISGDGISTDDLKQMIESALRRKLTYEEISD